MRAKRKEKDRAKKSRQENSLNFFVFHRSLSLTRFSHLSADCSFVKSSKTMASIASLHPAQLSRYKLSSMVVWLLFIPHIVYFECNPQPQNRKPGQHQYWSLSYFQLPLAVLAVTSHLARHYLPAASLVMLPDIVL